MKPDPHNSASPSQDDPNAIAVDTERLNNTHRAYREIRRRIMDGVMPPGAQFLEQELAELLGMSRTPVREALIRLQDDRLVEVKPRHGARVLGVSAEDLSDVYEISADLEASAVRRVTRTGLKADVLARLIAALEHMDRATVASDFIDWVHWDNEFHSTLVAAAGNQRLSDIFNSLMAQVYRARHSSQMHRSIPAVSNQEHRALMAAMTAGDADLAHKLMYEHRMRVRHELATHLRAAARST